MKEIKAVEFAFSLTIRHIGSLRNLFVCARGARETEHALIWVRRGACLSRGRRDVDKERVRARWNGREERHGAFFIWNGPWEGSDLIIFGLRVRETKWERMESRRRVRGGGRECEGEIKEVWLSSTQLLTATAVTSLHLLLLYLCSLLLFFLSFLPSFSPFLSFLPLGCQISLDCGPCRIT